MSVHYGFYVMNFGEASDAQFLFESRLILPLVIYMGLRELLMPREKILEEESKMSWRGLYPSVN
jgi:hypothetical protein